MITILSDGNYLVESKNKTYKLSTTNNNLLTEQFNIATNSFLPITSASASATSIIAQQEEQSLNLNFAYNMNQYVRDSDPVTFSNLTITGDTLLYGNLTIIPQSITKYQTTVVNIGDTLIELATNNLSDNIDIGLYGKYIKNSITNYAGIFRDAQNNGIFKLFKDLTIHPSNTPGAHINVSSTANQGDLMINSLYTGFIKCADYYYNLSINAKNGDSTNNTGGNITLTPGTGYNSGSNGYVILSNLSLVSTTETLLAITSDGKVKNTNLVSNNIPTLSNNNIFLNNLTVNGNYYGTWTGNSISTAYTDAKVTSVNGQTGAVNISSSGAVTSVNGQTGAITGLPALSSSNTFTNTNTFQNTTINLTNGSSIDLNYNDIYLIDKNNPNYGLKMGNVWGFSGPMLYGYVGGALGTTASGYRYSLTWDNNNDVVVTRNLTVANNLSVNNNLSVVGNYYGTWNGNSISTSYTDAKVTSVNGQTGSVNLDLNGAVTSINGATGAISNVAKTDSLNTFNYNTTFLDNTYVNNNKCIEFGANISGKETNAGKIGYNTFDSECLTIVGAGNTGGNRKVKIYDNLDVYGTISSSNINVTQYTIFVSQRSSVQVNLNRSGLYRITIFAYNNSYGNIVSLVEQYVVYQKNIYYLGNYQDYYSIYPKNIKIGSGDIFLKDGTSVVGYFDGGLYISNTLYNDINVNYTAELLHNTTTA